MRVSISLFLIVLLNGCIVWDLTPSYSSEWNENIWIHKKTKNPLPNEIHVECRKESLSPFRTENHYGLEQPVSLDDYTKSKYIYASCLKKNGFVFSASFKYCYKFKNICDEYDKYRK